MKELTLSNKMKLKRITDLFTEGDTCFLGDDENAKPVCIWVNKPNSLEEEEARMDAQSTRTQLLLAMSDPSHPEIQNANMILSEWTDEELFQAATNQKYEENITLAVHDIEADEEWNEKLEYIRRQPELLDDAKVPDDDPRRVQLAEYNTEYLNKVQELLAVRNDKTMKEVKEAGREKAEEDFMKTYKDKLSIDSYVMESKMTKLFYAMRECEAQRKGEGEWDHSKCNHSNRLVEHRGEIRELPEHVLNLVIQTFDNLAVGAKNLGNFPEPQSSSESSAPPNAVTG
jgi:hypothetical protein